MVGSGHTSFTKRDESWHLGFKAKWSFWCSPPFDEDFQTFLKIILKFRLLFAATLNGTWQCAKLKQKLYFWGLHWNWGSKHAHRDCIQVPEIFGVVLEPHLKPINIRRRASVDSKFQLQIVSILVYLPMSTKAYLNHCTINSSLLFRWFAYC